jgi:hypothetical protein
MASILRESVNQRTCETARAMGANSYLAPTTMSSNAIASGAVCTRRSSVAQADGHGEAGRRRPGDGGPCGDRPATWDNGRGSDVLALNICRVIPNPLACTCSTSPSSCSPSSYTHVQVPSPSRVPHIPPRRAPCARRADNPVHPRQPSRAYTHAPVLEVTFTTSQRPRH